MQVRKFDKRLINLYRGDFERLASIHPNSKPSIVIRELVRRHIHDIEQSLNEIMEHADA